MAVRSILQTSCSCSTRETKAISPRSVRGHRLVDCYVWSLAYCDARTVVQEGTENLGAGLPLAVIVPTEEDVQPFLDALKAHPKAIEGYVEPIEAQTIAATSAAEAAENDDDGAQILRLLHKLHKEGHFQDEAQLKVLKSLARKGNKQLLVTFKGSFSDGVMDEAQLDKEFFVENATELADEALAQDKQSN